MARSKAEEFAKILLIGDSPLLRSGLGYLVKQVKNARIQDEASSPTEALKKLREGSFDLAILVYDTASGLGLDLLEQLGVEFPSLPVLVINPFPSDHEALTIIRAKAAGYLGKKSTSEHFREALEKSLAGSRFISPSVAETIVFQMSTEFGDDSKNSLSPRESQVLSLIARGKKRSEIAETLCLSPQTISSYRSRVLEKLGLETNAQLIRYAVENRLV